MTNREQHNDLFHRGCELIKGHVLLGGQEVREITPQGVVEIRQGIELLNQVIEMNPQNWSAMWIIGKAHQALEEHQEAFDSFERSHRIERTHHDVLRELALEAHQLNKHDVGLYYADMAWKFEPDDSGLMANKALSLLLLGRTREAWQTASKAFNLDRSDEISKNLFEVTEKVWAGKSPCPKSIEELNSLFGGEV